MVVGSGSELAAQDKPPAAPQGARSLIRELKTAAERSEFQGTAREQEVLDFLAVLDRASPYARQFEFGRSTENRPMSGLIIAKDENVQLPLPPNDPRLVIVMIGNIHSGECDSKEALLALCRDLLVDVTPRYLDSAVLVVIPNFNPDGNERVGLLHRPGQEGPTAGTGTRENAVGLDLNRDFIKLDTPEVRALVRLLDVFDADALLDCHTTNGTLHRYDMTYDLSHNPAADQRIVKWIRTSLFPDVTNDLLKLGIPSFYYGNFNADHTHWESFGHEGRYSTEYMGLRGKIGILVESYSYASYQRRIEATYHFVDRCLTRLTDNRSSLKKWTHERESYASVSVPIQAKIGTDAQPVTAAGFAWSKPPSETDLDSTKPRARFPSPRDRKQSEAITPKDYSVELHNFGQSLLQVDAPEYYFLPHDNAWAASRLRMHGIELIPLESDDTTCQRTLSTANVVRYKIESRKELPLFQAHRLQKLEVRSEKIEWPSGGGWLVSTKQPLGRLATYLLEPHSDDSLAVWNFFDPQLKEGAPYPVLRIERISAARILPPPLPKLKLTDSPTDSMVRESLTLDKLYDPDKKVAYSGMPSPMPTWVPGESAYLHQHDNRWFKVDCATGSMAPFDKLDRLTAALARHPAIGESQAKSLGQRLGVFDERFENAMIEYKNDLFAYRSSTDEVQQLTDSPDAREELPELSPSGNHVAFVRENNLWIADCKTGATHALTTDGTAEILNGKLDWVYQEEVYGRGKFKGYWWSPDGSHIAFLRLDETLVPRFQIPNSLSFAQTLEETRYPKAGQNNPLVTLRVIDIASGESQEIPLDGFLETDRIIARVMWKPAPAMQVLVQVQNRIQNQLALLAYDVEHKSIAPLLTERSDAWIDVNDQPRYLHDGSFLWVSESSGRKHVERVSVDGARTSLTAGTWDIKDILAVTHDGTKVWLTAHRSSPVNTDLLTLDLVSGELTAEGATNGSHRVAVHPDGEFYFDAFSSARVSSQTWLCKQGGTRWRYVGGFRSDRFDYVQSSQPELFEIEARDGFRMQSMLYTPSNFHERAKGHRYPVLIHVYGGPAAPTVENSWTHRNDLWHRYLAEQGIVVLFCDNRSALGKGNSDTWKIYRYLGSVELRDLEDAVHWLNGQSWVDSQRIGMWGWSYGGYFTAYAMTHSKLFAAGISGAPVTDWRNYDSIYTERYMGLPDANPSGYKSSSVVDAASALHGKLLLIHGEIDDNVHIANTLQFANALQQSGKPFELMVYPNNRHGISNPNQSWHQFQLMTEFLKRTLKPEKR